MNYLAHLYLSDPTPLAWAGSLMGDFFKGADFSGMPRELVRHLKLHRRVDHLTRESQVFQTSRRRLDQRYGLARSLMVDVFYDHLLAQLWVEFSPQPLAVFSREVYTGLRACQDSLSPKLQRQLPRMISHDWLTAYQHHEVVSGVLLRLQTRLRNRIHLADGAGQLTMMRSQLESDFRVFMGEAVEFVASWKAAN